MGDGRLSEVLAGKSDVDMGGTASVTESTWSDYVILMGS
jgi:hypothetical protein